MAERNVTQTEVASSFKSIADHFLDADSVLQENDRQLATLDVKSEDEGIIIGKYLQNCLNQNAEIRRAILLKLLNVADFAKGFGIIMQDYVDLTNKLLENLDDAYPFVPTADNIGFLLDSMYFGDYIPEGFSLVLTTLDFNNVDNIYDLMSKYYDNDSSGNLVKNDLRNLKNKTIEQLTELFGKNIKGNTEVPLIGFLAFSTKGSDVSLNDIATKLGDDSDSYVNFLKDYYEDKGFTVDVKDGNYILRNSSKTDQLIVPTYASNEDTILQEFSKVLSTNEKNSSISIIDGENYYIAKKGDNLGDIAEKFGISTEELVEINEIKNPNKIQIGQSIKLPANVSPTKASSEIGISIYRTQEKSYVVQKDDTLYEIAKKYGISQNELEKLNPNIDPNKINPNDIVKLPNNVKDTEYSGNTLTISPEKEIVVVENSSTLTDSSSRLNTYNLDSQKVLNTFEQDGVKTEIFENNFMRKTYEDGTVVEFSPDGGHTTYGNGNYTIYNTNSETGDKEATIYNKDGETVTNFIITKNQGTPTFTVNDNKNVINQSNQTSSPEIMEIKINDSTDSQSASQSTTQASSQNAEYEAAKARGEAEQEHIKNAQSRAEERKNSNEVEQQTSSQSSSPEIVEIKTKDSIDSQSTSQSTTQNASQASSKNAEYEAAKARGEAEQEHIKNAQSRAEERKNSNEVEQQTSSPVQTVETTSKTMAEQYFDTKQKDKPIQETETQEDEYTKQWITTNKYNDGSKETIARNVLGMIEEKNVTGIDGTSTTYDQQNRVISERTSNGDTIDYKYTYFKDEPYSTTIYKRIDPKLSKTYSIEYGPGVNTSSINTAIGDGPNSAIISIKSEDVLNNYKGLTYGQVVSRVAKDLNLDIDQSKYTEYTNTLISASSSDPDVIAHPEKYWTNKLSTKDTFTFKVNY